MLLSDSEEVKAAVSSLRFSHEGTNTRYAHFFYYFIVHKYAEFKYLEKVLKMFSHSKSKLTPAESLIKVEIYLLFLQSHPNASSNLSHNIAFKDPPTVSHMRGFVGVKWNTKYMCISFN